MLGSFPSPVASEFSTPTELGKSCVVESIGDSGIWVGTVGGVVDGAVGRAFIGTGDVGIMFTSGTVRRSLWSSMSGGKNL